MQDVLRIIISDSVYFRRKVMESIKINIFLWQRLLTEVPDKVNEDEE